MFNFVVKLCKQVIAAAKKSCPKIFLMFSKFIKFLDHIFCNYIKLLRIYLYGFALVRPRDMNIETEKV